MPLFSTDLIYHGKKYVVKIFVGYFFSVEKVTEIFEKKTEKISNSDNIPSGVSIESASYIENNN